MKELQRIVTSGPCLVTLSSPSSHAIQLDAEVRDISQRGAKIWIADRHAPSEVERLEFPVPEFGAAFNVSATLRWCCEAGEETLFGCSFADRLPYMAWASLASKGSVERRNESADSLPRVAVAWDGHGGSDAQIKDYSTRGLSLICQKAPVANGVVSILVPGGRLLIRAEAKWCRPCERNYLVGFSFLGSADAQRFTSSVESYLLAHVMESVTTEDPQADVNAVAVAGA